MQGLDADGSAARLMSQLAPLVGKPTRITFLDPAIRTRLLRIIGLVAEVTDGQIATHLREPLESTPSAYVCQEIMAGSELIWFNTSVSAASAHQLWLAHPDQIHTGQRRQHPRVDVELPLHANGLAPLPVSVQMRDISAGGALLRSAVPASPGQTLQLIFAVGSGLYFQDLRAEVVRCAPDAGGTYAIGLRFQLSPEQEARLAAWVHQQRERFRAQW